MFPHTNGMLRDDARVNVPVSANLMIRSNVAPEPDVTPPQCDAVCKRGVLELLHGRLLCCLADAMLAAEAS